MQNGQAKRPRRVKRETIPSSSAQRRLFVLATSLVARGMEPKAAYENALHYIQGPGRGRTWIRALAEQDSLDVRSNLPKKTRNSESN
jgi:hypothetical protein